MNLKIIKNYKQGFGVSGLGRKFNLLKSMISIIGKNKDKLGLWFLLDINMYCFIFSLKKSWNILFIFQIQTY